jgi:hypothetical protein
MPVSPSTFRSPLLTIEQVAYFRQTTVARAYKDSQLGLLPRTVLADGSEFQMFGIVVPARKLRSLLDEDGQRVLDAWLRGEAELPFTNKKTVPPAPFPAHLISHGEKSDER